MCFIVHNTAPVLISINLLFGATQPRGYPGLLSSMAPIKKSKVWRYFTVSPENRNVAICSICNASISRGSNTPRGFTTSGMRKHIMSRHHISLDETAVSNKENTHLTPTESHQLSNDLKLPTVPLSSVQHRQPRKHRRRSHVWKYFTDSCNDRNVAVCNICLTPVALGAKSANTSNMRKHVIARHQISLESPPTQVNDQEVAVQTTSMLQEVVSGQQEQGKEVSVLTTKSIPSSPTPAVEPRQPDRDTCVQLGKPSRRTSKVWEYFTDSCKDKTVAICNICLTPVALGSKSGKAANTSNMRKHAIDRHHISFDLTEELINNRKIPSLSNELL